jgi:hypothetical protein
METKQKIEFEKKFNEFNEIVKNEAMTLMAVIERVAMSESSDITKLEKMLDMQERILNRNAAQSFSSDMAVMQGEMPRVFKLASGHNTTYARLEDINDAIRPTLQKFGFAVTFTIDQPDKHVRITAILSHRDGHTQTSSLTLPLDTSGSKNSVQAIGSTVSYGKRYTLCALLNISTGDDTNGYDLGSNKAKELNVLSDFITPDQVDELVAACDANGVSIHDLEARANATIDKITSSRFGAAMTWVLKKGGATNA